ncbi:UDP:flavonoid glycosyltransferase YjiC (YdhE family) [Nocardia tenerifensis]|uniref:UDP:flavonoid glycosyltransferase YjiC (YdhE family) n=1 Tax=Nocardia tenerifensis TaxID=228006 RepID=A0A318JVH4_9NOCA|nr:nucleotide disphospho-sugar-binding domain-containing protein [Nocardia tenerifensis]PXX59755.1 UDP:flavonoid glycosyltransferase YjiC (YdhE family) [Nocardia tenerifensis]
MRVLIATWNIPGHLRPLAPLGWALRARGHEVVVVSNPDMVPTILGTGLPAFGAGPDYDSFAVLRTESSRRAWKPETEVLSNDPTVAAQQEKQRQLIGFGLAAAAARAQAADAVAFAERWRPDLVVFEPTGLVGPLIGTLLGVPTVRHLWSIDFTAPIEEYEQEIVGELAAPYGLTRIGVNGTITLDPAPSRLQLDDGRSRSPIRFIPYNGPAVLQPWLLEPSRRPRIGITWGTSKSTLGFDHMVLAPRVVAALARRDVELAVAVTEDQRALFDDVPGNVVHLGPVPLDALAATCSVLVNGGGAGSVLTAAANGVAQLVISHMPDEVVHGERVRESGAGLHLPGADLTDGDIDAVVRRLFDAEFRTAAAELRDDIRSRPTPFAVVEQLERLVGDRVLTAQPS